VTAPTVDPHARDDVAAPDSYHPDDPVWVWRDGEWHEGTVRGTGWLAVLVDFRTAIGGNAVDTVRAEYVMRRDPAEPASLREDR
jgi:hypothetical protein